MKTVSAFQGDVFSNDTKSLVNRSGATTVKGSIGFIDLAQSDTDSTTLLAGLSNVIATATAQIDAGCMVVAKAAGVTDNSAGDYYVGEGVVCYVNVNSTTDIAKGDELKPVNAGDHMVKAAAGDRYHAIALEARTSDDEGPILALIFSFGRKSFKAWA